jgi:hypothetical protein
MDTTKTVNIASSNHNFVNDEMASVYNMDSFTSNLGFNSQAATPSVIYPGGVVFDNATFNGDKTRIHRNDSNNAEIVYNVTNVKNFRAAIYQNVSVSNGMAFYQGIYFREGK